jgi:hypothetical protein
MSYKKEVHVFSPDQADFLERRMGEKVAEILQLEYAGQPSPIKLISGKTSVAPGTIKNWYIGRNPPRLAHFLILARNYTAILNVLLNEIGGRDLQEGYASLGPKLISTSNSSLPEDFTKIYSAENCTINFALPLRIARKLNLRQVWFLARLKEGKKVTAENISVQWQVSSRQARTDIADMIRLKLIIFIGANKTGMYILINKPS